jgi:DNA polymerase-1
MARVESNGIKIDTDYVRDSIQEVKGKIAKLDEEIRADPIYATWRRAYRDGVKLGARQQLAHVLQLTGHMQEVRTKKGKRRADRALLDTVDLPIVKVYLQRERLGKVLSTYLRPIVKETCNGLLHPFFNLNTTVSYRSSSSLLNFQNIPVRDPEQGSYVRKAFISRWGKRGQVGEIDFKGIEVCVSACYNKDPVLINYIKDTKSDMHRDMAMQLYCIASQDEVSKDCRYNAKNQFVFAEFYGSYYAQCAVGLWNAIDKYHLTTKSGQPIRELLAAKGITKLGDCNPKKTPRRGTFERHVQEVEEDFWGRRFKVYAQWRKDWYKAYLRDGGFNTLTGFRIEGVFERNKVINYPVQGSAFHCLLWSLIRLQDWLTANGFKSLIIGQIHDSIIFDFVEDEIQAILTRAHEITCEELPREWPWIIVPMNTEVEIAPPKKAWHFKKPWTNQAGTWRAAA